MHWSKGPNAEEIRARLSATVTANHWSRGPKAEATKAHLLATHWAYNEKAPSVKRKLAKANSTRVVTEETKQKMRAKRFFHTDEAKQKMRKPKSEKARAGMVAGHHSKKIGRDSYSALIKQSRTPEVIFKIAEGVRLGLSGFKLSKKGWVVDKLGREFYMRSTWEVLVANWLDEHDYIWDYEPETLMLDNGFGYIPDFRLSDGRLLEVKGYLTQKGREKIAGAERMGYRVVLINKRFLQKLGIL
jgi:hypothetical protein